MTKSTRSPWVFAWFGLVLVASVGLYRTSDRVQHLDLELREINAGIESEQQRLHVLKAEWVYLSNPARLEAAARKHLALRPTSLKQITSIEQAENALSARGSQDASAAPATKSAYLPKIATRLAASVPSPKRQMATAETATTPTALRTEAKAEAKRPQQAAAPAHGSAVSKTASAQPLPDSIGALLDHVAAHP